MRKGICILAALLVVVATKAYFETGSTDSRWSVIETASAANSACIFPTKMAATPEQTAWQLFVAANCKASNGQLLWETWVEQSTLYPASGKAGGAVTQLLIANRLHSSPLALAHMKKTNPAMAELTTPCNAMQAPPPPGSTTPPMVKDPTVCEEVHLNPPAQKFITSHQYQTRPPQTMAAQKGTNIQFPSAAIEVKVDWIPASDFAPPFTCANPPAGVHVETIGGTCYAMAGMHVISKLIGQWLWATFEPQSMATNPLRCITFGPCNDPWGSIPATSNGGASGFTKPSPALAALMQQAGLPPEFLNYRLVGTQTEFVTSSGAPIYLGNSIIEGENVGQQAGTSSCITCHSVSSIENNGTDGITKINDQVGPPYKIPPGWIARDFVWSMGLACPDVPNGGGLQTCTSSKAPAKPAKK